MQKRPTKTKGQEENRAWKAFSRYVRKRGESFDGTAECVTCGKRYPVEGRGCIQAGHYISRRFKSLKFHPLNVWPQCYNCNINLAGDAVVYRQKLAEIDKKLPEYLESFMATKVQPKKDDWVELQSAIKEATALGYDDAPILAWWVQFMCERAI